MEQWFKKSHPTPSTYIDGGHIGGDKGGYKPSPPHFALRLTPKDLGIDVEFLKSLMTKASEWVISWEGGTSKKQFHFHLLYNGPSVVPLVKEKYPQLVGNGYFSESVVDDFNKYFSYVLKDGSFEFFGFPKPMVDEYLGYSYKKSGDGDMSQELDKLRIWYLKQSERNTYELLCRLIQLNVKFNKKINVPHLKSIVLLWECKRSEKSIGDLASVISKDISRQFDPDFFLFN